jgi:hypothetical protein
MKTGLLVLTIIIKNIFLFEVSCETKMSIITNTKTTLQEEIV